MDITLNASTMRDRISQILYRSAGAARKARMDTLTSILSPDDILLDLDVADRDALFDALGQHWLKRRGLGADAVSISLRSRESLGSTGLGKGVALPHARLPELNQALVAFVRTGAALPFDSPDAEPVSLFWVLLVPTDAPEQSLKLLADAAEIFSKAYLRENLRVAESAEAVLALLRERA